jgi:hypothetical protein
MSACGTDETDTETEERLVKVCTLTKFAATTLITQPFARIKHDLLKMSLWPTTLAELGSERPHAGA